MEYRVMVACDAATLIHLNRGSAMLCDAGIDLHAINRVVVVIDEADRELYQQRLRNDLALILTALEPDRATVQGVAIESTSVSIQNFPTRHLVV